MDAGTLSLSRLLQRVVRRREASATSSMMLRSSPGCAALVGLPVREARSSRAASTGGTMTSLSDCDSRPCASAFRTRCCHAYRWHMSSRSSALRRRRVPTKVIRSLATVTEHVRQIGHRCSDRRVRAKNGVGPCAHASLHGLASIVVHAAEQRYTTSPRHSGPRSCGDPRARSKVPAAAQIHRPRRLASSNVPAQRPAAAL